MGLLGAGETIAHMTQAQCTFQFKSQAADPLQTLRRDALELQRTHKNARMNLPTALHALRPASHTPEWRRL